MLVRSAMLAEPLIVAPETKLLEFVRAVLRCNQTTAAVVREDRLVGVVSIYDVFRRILPAHVDQKTARLIREEYFEERFAKLSGTTVAEIMTREVVHLRPDDTVIEAVAISVRKNHKTFPVLDGGRYVGTVTRRSILRRVTTFDEPEGLDR